jgi:hypothetical protein
MGIDRTLPISYVGTTVGCRKECSFPAYWCKPCQGIEHGIAVRISFLVMGLQHSPQIVKTFVNAKQP